VLCHDPTRTTIDEYPDYPIADLQAAIDYYVAAGRLTNPAVRCVGVSINSSALSDSEWRDYQRRVSSELGLPVADPMRGGLSMLADRLLAS
jgi:uncharacterized NAD-dependent epimerase/dehydratase family protein